LVAPENSDLEPEFKCGVSKSNTVITALQFCAIIILFREDAADKFILISNATLLVLLLRATKRDHSQLTTLASELCEPSGPGDGIG